MNKTVYYLNAILLLLQYVTIALFLGRWDCTIVILVGLIIDVGLLIIKSVKDKKMNKVLYYLNFVLFVVGAITVSYFIDSMPMYFVSVMCILIEVYLVHKSNVMS